ncbi:hypothetical protein A2U01_0004127 [Trifolium medium]|uniref:Uncharacterized protein n=1 Tax=Trifolium medium TaxID=97028 RepID=A0A392M943_9FABA|nr:hypothetical protein [Trifolium medium]
MEKHADKENTSIKVIMRELDDLILHPKPSRSRVAVKTMFYRIKGKIEKDRRMKAVDDLQNEIIAIKEELDKVDEKITVEERKNAKAINKTMMDAEISREIMKERFEIKRMVDQRLQVLKHRIAKVMAKYGTVLEPSTPVSA